MAHLCKMTVVMQVALRVHEPYDDEAFIAASSEAWGSEAVELEGSTSLAFGDESPKAQALQALYRENLHESARALVSEELHGTFSQVDVLACTVDEVI